MARIERSMVAWALAAIGCGGLGLEATGEEPRGHVSDDGIELQVGVATGVRVTSADDDQLSAMRTLNDAIAGVFPTGRPHEYVVFGISEGSTAIEVLVDSESKGQVPVTVSPYPSPEPPQGVGDPGDGGGDGGGGRDGE